MYNTTPIDDEQAQSFIQSPHWKLIAETGGFKNPVYWNDVTGELLTLNDEGDWKFTKKIQHQIL